MQKKFESILSFIRDLYNEKHDFIPLHAPVFIGNEKKYVNDCINSTFVSSVGKYVDAFEQKMAEYTGSSHAVTVVNGTAALQLALQLSGVGDGDLVITQPLTFVATANAIVHSKASPLFVDVDIDTMGLSPKALKQFLEEETELQTNDINGLVSCTHKSTGKRIAACVPMHTFGHPCRIDEIAEICHHYGIELVEDAAESLGSFYKGKHTGTFGRAGIFSFNGNKTITTGGGGMIVTNDAELAKK
ncbi:MAG: aminotransferase class I/II-fold pyridoxal phosphate-dependent enzyme, partial [bacterium]